MAIASNKVNFSGVIIMLIILSCVVIAFLGNGLYLLSCLVAFYSILYILWKNNRPGILVFAFLMQWAQVTAYVVWMNNGDWDIDHFSRHAGDAVVLSCIGLVIMAAVIAKGVASIPIPTREEFFQEAKKINEKKIFLLYLFSTLFLSSFGLLSGVSGGFAQIFLTFASVKWIFFLVYGYVAWVNKKNRVILGLMIFFEFSTSLYSYFSTFKEVILMTIILAITFIKTINIRQLINGFLIVLLVGFLLITWTSIKSNYRAYLNQGSKQQVVEVTRTDAFSKIFDEVSVLTWKDYQASISAFLYRVQYILHLAKTMDRVPEVLPYEYGQVWLENVTYVLKPRLFFPDKPIYEATKKTNKYTGVKYSGFKQGASFSLGYFADAYIDFGYVGMFIPLAFVALFVALIYRRIYRFKKINILLRYAMINVALYDFTAFESDGLFLFGRLMLLFLVTWFLCLTVFPRLQTWLYKTT